jgi:hypothetical protein
MSRLQSDSSHYSCGIKGDKTGHGSSIPGLAILACADGGASNDIPGLTISASLDNIDLREQQGLLVDLVINREDRILAGKIRGKSSRESNTLAF